MTASLTLSHLAVTRPHSLEGTAPKQGRGGGGRECVDPTAFITLDTVSMDGDSSLSECEQSNPPCLGGAPTLHIQSHSLTPNTSKAFLILLEFLNAPLEIFDIGMESHSF